MNKANWTIQLLIFIFFIVAFTLNHFELKNECDCSNLQRQSDLRPYFICTGVADLRDRGLCTGGEVKTLFSLKENPSEKIVADILFLLISGGALYFIKNKRF